MRKKEILLTLGIFAMLLQAAFSSWVSSTTGEFKVSPSVVYINWTDTSGLGAYTANISVNNTKDYNITIEILNYSANAVLAPVFDLDVENISYCYFIGERNDTKNKYTCINFSVIPSNEVLVENNSVKNFTLKLEYLPTEYPGRYRNFVNLPIINKTNSTENVSIIVYVDIPVNFTQERHVKIGKYSTAGNYMTYEIPANNAGKQDAHFYYFNASEIANASAIFVNISSSKLAMFLFDEYENFLENSANTSTGKHELLYSPEELPKDRYLKLYIYGNDTQPISYEAFISIFAIQALNASDLSQSFGYNKQMPFVINFSAGENNFTSVFVLKNKGNYNYSNVAESKRVELIYEFTSQTGNNTHYFIVPSSTQDIHAELIFNDTNANYSLFLKDYNGNVLRSAYYTKGYYEEIVNKSRVELSYQASLSPGKYSIEVVNISGNAEYNLTIYLNLSSSDFVSTNYSSYSSKDFREFGIENDSKIVSFNFTLPSTSIPGIYKVTLTYRENNGKGAGIKIPIFVKAVGTNFLVDKKLQNQITLTATQNLERNVKFNLSFIIENFGNYNITDVFINFTNLTLSTSSGVYYANITAIYINDTKYSQAFTIQNDSQINVTIEILVNKTKASQEGIYQGYVLLNMSNSKFKVKPYDYLNVTIKLNMTKWLIVKSASLSPSSVNVSVSAKNVTLTFKVYYANNSAIVAGEIGLNNILSIILVHKNLTTRVKNVTSTKSFAEGTTIWSSPVYKLNISIPRKMWGGYYDVIFNFTTKDTNRLVGKGKTLLAVQDEALAVDVLYPSQSLSMQNGTEKWLNISITNYGLDNIANAQLKIESNLIQEVTFSSKTGDCNVDSVSNKVITFDINAQKSCNISMKIKASGSSGSGTVYLKGASGLWIKNDSFQLTVTAPSSSSSQEEETTQETQQTTQQQEEEEEEEVWISDFKFISYPSLISIEQGKSKIVSVSVKNTGNLTLVNLSLVVENIESSWVKISNPVSLSAEETHSFTVNFTIPKNAKLGKREITFKVYSKNLSKSVKATLEILPSEEYKMNVEQNLTIAKEIYENLTVLYNEYVERGIENKTINSTLLSIQSLIVQAESLIKANDYQSAASIISSALTLLQRAKTQIQSLEEIAKKKERESTFMTLGIILIIFGVCLIVYLLLPPPHGYEPERGFRYVPPHHRGKPKLKRLVEEIKHKCKIIKKKIKQLKKSEV